MYTFLHFWGKWVIWKQMMWPMLKPFWGAGEMEEVLRALGALSEDPGCVFSTHITTYNTCNQPRFLGVQHPLFVSKDMHVCGTHVQELTHTPEMKINLKQLLDSVMAERAPPHKYNITGNFKKWFTVSVLFCFEHLYHENFSSFYMFLETWRQCLYASPHYICNT